MTAFRSDMPRPRQPRMGSLLAASIVLAAWIQGFAAPDSARAAAADSVRTARADSAAAPEAAPPRPERFRSELYDVEDPRALADLWIRSGAAGTFRSGDRHQVLVTRGLGPAKSYLLREGTQVGVLPDSVPPPRGLVRARDAGTERGLSRGLLANVWNPADPLEPFQWPTGLSAELTHAVTGLHDATGQIEQHYGLAFGARPLRWINAEVGVFRSRYAGGVRRNLFNPFDSAGFRTWERSHPRGYVALGIPGARWEFAIDNRHYPEYYWLDPRAGEGSYVVGRDAAGFPVTADEGYRGSRLLRRWRTGGDNLGPRPNVSQALRLRAGQLRYAAILDPDVYTAVIHDAMFEDLPAPFGRWGFGFVAAPGTVHSRLRLDLFPVAFGFAPRGSRGELSLLRIDMTARDGSTFRIAATTALRLDSPFLRPGGTP